MGGAWWVVQPAFRALGVLLLVLGLLPAAVIVCVPRGRVPRAATLSACGVLLGLAGSVLVAQNSFLELRLASISWRIFGQSPHAVAPLGLDVAGIVAVAIGIGLAVGRLALLRIGMVGSSLIALWFAASLLITSGLLSGGRRLVDGGSLITAGGFVAVMLLALVSVPRLRQWVPPAIVTDPVLHPSDERRRRLRSIALITAAALAAVAIGAWGWIAAAPRLALAEVFPDVAFAVCVAAELGHDDASATVSASALDDVRSLTCNGDLDAGSGPAGGSDRISSIEGTQRLSNLATLDLSNNTVTDLAPLTGLRKLGSLKLTHNNVVDLAPLAGLPVLADLGASDNLISDLRPLAQIPTLVSLGLSINRIADLTPLAGLSSLSSLSADRNELSDVTALTGLLRLETLSLAENRIVNPEQIADLPALSELDLAQNQIPDASLFVGFASVSELWIGGNPISDVRPLQAMPSLIGVDLEGADPATTVGIEELRASGVYVGGLA